MRDVTEIALKFVYLSLGAMVGSYLQVRVRVRVRARVREQM